jgi:hypothetical protein
MPGAVTAGPITPAPGKTPLKPVSPVPTTTPDANKKSGTSVIKAAPPKETARITVKPNLPGSVGARPAGAAPVVAAVAAGAVAAVVAGKAMAATTTPKATPTAATAATPTAKAGTAKAPAAAPTAAPAPARFQEEGSGSTLVSTVLAGVLALITWGVAGFLFASVYGFI